jgi:tetratricopeptide (TPR) repeat protein
MDCRRTLFVALGLLGATAGCVPSSGLPVTSSGSPSVSAAKESDQSKRQLKPSTCVAIGIAAEESASDTRRSPAEQEELRDKARQAYQEALKNDPNDLAALRALAKLYTTISDHDRAVATYQRAIKAHPKDPSLLYDLGMYHARCKEWDPAIASLRRALDLDPEGRLYVHSLGFCLARAGRYQESFDAFAKLEGEPMAHYNLARMLQHMHENDLAKEHLRLALKTKPDFSPAQQLLAVLEGPGTNASKDAAWDVIMNMF